MEESVSQKEKEKAEEEMIEQAFQELLNDYLATKHRKRVEIITKAFNFANQAHKGNQTPFGRALYHAPHRRCQDCVQ